MLRIRLSRLLVKLDLLDRVASLTIGGSDDYLLLTSWLKS
jgi:hypothetical protein